MKKLGQSIFGAGLLAVCLGLVGTLCGAPALASEIIPLPPQFPPPVQFTNNGAIKGTLQTQGMALPFTGTLDYLSVNSQQQLRVSVDAEQITSDLWVTTTPTVINEWKIVSTDPTTCGKEVLSGASYPQCTAFSNPSPNEWSNECTVTLQGKQATVDFTYTLTGNLVASFVEKITISGMVADIIKITVDSQGSFPPDSSVFDLPSICNAPNGNNQSGNDNSQGNELGQCTATIPSVCL